MTREFTERNGRCYSTHPSSPDTHPEDELYGEDIRRPQANDDSQNETSEEESSPTRPPARGTGLTTRWPREREYRVRHFGADSEVLGSARERLRRRSLSRARILRSRILVYDSSSDLFILWFQNTDHFRSYEYFLRRRPSVAAMIALYVWVGSHVIGDPIMMRFWAVLFRRAFEICVRNQRLQILRSPIRRY